MRFSSVRRTEIREIQASKNALTTSPKTKTNNPFYIAASEWVALDENERDKWKMRTEQDLDLIERYPSSYFIETYEENGYNNPTLAMQALEEVLLKNLFQLAATSKIKAKTKTKVKAPCAAIKANVKEVKEVKEDVKEDVKDVNENNEAEAVIASDNDGEVQPAQQQEQSAEVETKVEAKVEVEVEIEAKVPDLVADCMKKSALHILENLTFQNNNHKIQLFNTPDLVSTLIIMIKSGGTIMIKEAAMRIIMNFSSAIENRVQMVNVPNLMDIILDTVKNGESSEIKQLALSTFGNLSIASDNKKPLFDKPGFIDMVLDVIKS